MLKLKGYSLLVLSIFLLVVLASCGDSPTLAPSTANLPAVECLPEVTSTGDMVQACLNAPTFKQDSDVKLLTRLVVSGKAVPDAKMETKWNYKFFPSDCKGTTDSSGVATCIKNIGNATIDYKVNLEVKFTTSQNKTYSATTFFTTISKAATPVVTGAVPVVPLGNSDVIATTTTTQNATTQAATTTSEPTPTFVIPSSTPIPPTSTPIPPTNSPIPPTNTPTLPTATPKPSFTVTFLTVRNVRRGSNAYAQVQTAAGAACSIVYFVPSGRVSTAAGLTDKTANASGIVDWTWLISGNTGPGTGSITVTCNGVSARANIVISS